MPLHLPEQPPDSRRDLGERTGNTMETSGIPSIPHCYKSSRMHMPAHTCVCTHVHVHTCAHTGTRESKKCSPTFFLVSQEVPILQLIWQPEATGRWGNRDR